VIESKLGKETAALLLALMVGCSVFMGAELTLGAPPLSGAGLAVVSGKILYNEQPVSVVTNKDALIWLRNESSGQSIEANPTYNNATGEYTIPDLPAGEYGISVFFDSALPLNGENGFSGDFDGFNRGIVVTEGQASVSYNITVVETLHLTSPVDNAAVIGPWSSPEDTYPTEEMVFSWEALPEASSYHARIVRWQTPSYEFVGLAAEKVTSDLTWTVALPMSEENQIYVFELVAYNLNNLLVGKLMVPYGAGFGWDYRFRLAAEVSVESCGMAAQKKDTFNIGETVYLTGVNFSASKTLDVYIVTDQVTWTDGMEIPERLAGTAITVSSDNEGNISSTAVWTDPQVVGKYDVVVDANGNGQYDEGIDALDDSDIEVTAGFTIPEFSSYILVAALVVASLLAIAVPRRRSLSYVLKKT